MKQLDLFKAEKLKTLKRPNPMLKWGAGPIGRLCKECVHIVKVDGGTKKYIKCLRRGITRGSGTDHRANWQCCTYFEESTDE